MQPITKEQDNQKQPRVVKDKGCPFCKAKHEPMWEEYEQLRPYLSSRGRILSREISFVCVKHQRRLAESVKHARHLALLPFIAQEA